PSGLAEKARVDADRHHLWVACARFASILIHGSLDEVNKVRRPGEPLRKDEPRVVIDKRVRQDQVPPAGDIDEIGKIVVVSVRVVKESAFLHDQLAGVDAGGVSMVTADRAAPAGPAKRLDRHLDPVAFLVSIEQPDFFPAPAMAARLVPRAPDPFPNGGVPLKRDGRRVDGYLQVVLVEYPQQPPDAGPAPILVHRLGAEVTKLLRQRVGDLGHPLVAPVAEGLRILRALFVVDNDADRDSRVVRPMHVWWKAPVSDKIAPRPWDVQVVDRHARSKPAL